MNEKINPTAFAAAGAIVGALSMLILGILGNIGIYKGAVEMMMTWRITH